MQSLDRRWSLRIASSIVLTAALLALAPDPAVCASTTAFVPWTF